MDILKLLLTSLFSAVALFIITKAMGHKQVAQLDFFDYITGITIGSIAAEMATELEEPWKPLIAMVIYGGASVLLNFITEKVTASRKYINGTPTILMDNGKLYRANFRKAKLDLSEFMLLCRDKGYFHLSDIQTAVFEHNGKLAILPRSDARPITAKDISLELKKDLIEVEVIADGRILGENLKRRGLDEKWLERQLREQGYKSCDEVFLGVCDGDNNLTLYPME